MALREFAEAWSSVSTALSALAFGAIVGAVNKAVNKTEPTTIKIAIAEGVASIGAGIVGGGLFYVPIVEILNANEIFAAMAASATCAFFGDKIFKRIAERMGWKNNASDSE